MRPIRAKRAGPAVVEFADARWKRELACSGSVTVAAGRVELHARGRSLGRWRDEPARAPWVVPVLEDDLATGHAKVALADREFKAPLVFAARNGPVLVGSGASLGHDLFAPASPDRARVVPRPRLAAASPANKCGEALAADRQRSMTWAQRLKRVFTIDMEVCRRCGGRLRVIASIEEQATIDRILEHLGCDAESVDPGHPSRAPPRGGPLF